ncbi:MAG: hypothetical protein ACOCUV_03865 [bacterium]
MKIGNSQSNQELIEMTTITKQAYSEEEIPTADELALYVESLKLYKERNSNIDEKYIELIDNLPTPRKITQDFSNEEANILFETVGYLWREITGNSVVIENKSERGTLPFIGNYWLIQNGIMLHGINHYTIVKNNSSLFCSLLNINGFALQHYLAGQPNMLIKFIIENGGTRMLAKIDNKAFFQMAEQTYAKWGKSKVKKLNFKEKIIKIIDLKVPFNGWNSGIPIIIRK